ncbi:hypothetical protein Mgra_00008006 [Meloidogyne graminicola]|uniref:Uncharacterized protein n=1 Tax=Meloidogyne graminicola TaxID=189291 RepID=A0A8S9ZH48_9BILA|nr:hypothetical protein Mgra_00008006 [Meloidogyne graminicola]
MNNNENLSPSAQLPRTRNANFPINDSNIVNKLYSTRLNGTMSTEDDEQAIVLPMGNIKFFIYQQSYR